MNKILREISKIVKENLKKYLPEISTQDLEEDGKIYYMNDRNGTIFDYYTNNHLSPFMCFYDDKENMGAIKLILYIDGKIDIYLFKNHINDPYKEISTSISVTHDEILELAVIMNKVADNDNKWGFAIDSVLISYLINKKVGDVLIRVSNDEFEFDDNKKEIFITKIN